MQILVSTEQRYYRIPDGTYWSSGGLSYAFWRRYAEVFDDVVVLARALPICNFPTDIVRADGPNVRFLPVPYYVGPYKFLRVASKVRSRVNHAVSPNTAVIIRAPSLLGTMLESQLMKTNRPFGIEVVGDPDQVFASKSVRHPLRRFFRIWFRRAQERQCRNAVGVAYVTEHVLQDKYPCKAFESSISDVDVSDSWIVDRPKGFFSSYSSIELITQDYADSIRIEPAIARRVRLILVGSLEQLYKGPDLAIKALALLAREKRNIELVVIGGGKYLQSLKKIAASEGVSDLVIFRGRLPTPDDVRNELDIADLFILPSRTEGLPRALIEAMARGLPCIGADVGGIPELLPPEDLVSRGDFRALARKIKEVLLSQSRMQAMAERNLLRAKEFHTDALRIKRNEFYGRIRTITEEWLRRR